MLHASVRHDDIEALARATFGARCRVIAWHPTNQDAGTMLVFATLAFPARVVVLKLADAESPNPPYAREAAIQQRVARETPVPVAEVLAVDDSCRTFPWRYLMMSHAPGMDWRAGLERMSPQARRDMYYQLGKATAALHSLRSPRFGEVEETSPPTPLLQGEGSQTRANTSLSLKTPVSLPVAGIESIDALTARARRRIANPAHADLFVQVLQARASDFAGIIEARLTHEDLNPSNLLLVPGEEEGDEWHLAAVLDFGSAWAGCPESDLARLELWRDMMGEGFREGYTATRPIADDYPRRRPVYQLLWCLEYARPTPAHHADTARVCAELGVAPVTFG